MADMVKVKILKPVGPYMPGQEVEVSAEEAGHLADGRKAQLMADFEKDQAAKKDVGNMTAAQMQQAGLKNVQGSESQKADAAVYAKAEAAALNGKPVASGQPLTVTGGVTPPTMVYPAMADAAGHDVTDAAEVKKPEAKKEEKKADKQADKK